MTSHIPASIASSVLLTLLAGCGGSGDSAVQTGTLNIGLTDNPVDHADAVVVAFTGIELKAAADGAPRDAVIFDADSCDDFDAATGTCSINLLDLANGARKVVFSEQLPPGRYEWIRLLVDADRNEMDSYLEIGDQMCSLWIPSGAQTGLKIVSGVTVTANGVSDYTLDFDVRRSLTAPPGLATFSTEACAQNYILKPAIRIVDDTETGSIEGSFAADLLTDANGDLLPGCRDEDPTDGVVDHLAVYVFEDFEAADPVSIDDYDGDAGDPITAATVEGDGTSYAYKVGYLLAGSYKLGLTCTPDMDVMPGGESQSPAANNYDCDFGNETGCEVSAIPFDFVAERAVTVEVDMISSGDFPAPENL